MELDWIDLPNDDYSLVLGYRRKKTSTLNSLIESYHGIPKDEESSLEPRINSLEEIITHLTKWLSGELDPSEKPKHLRFIQEIAVKKKNYLVRLQEIYANQLYTKEAMEVYHRDTSGLSDSSKTAIVLTHVHWFSLKQKYYWGDFWNDSIDPCNRVLTPFYDQWERLKNQNDDTPHFFLWLETQHIPNYVPRVWYFNDDQRTKTNVSVENGQLCYKNKSSQPPVHHPEREERLIFAIDLDKEIYIAEERATPMGKIQHSSFTCGKPVLGAGVIAVNDGYIEMIALESGHYLPNTDIGFQILKIFREKGMEMNEIELQYFYDRNKYIAILSQEECSSLERYNQKLEETIKITTEKKRAIA